MLIHDTLSGKKEDLEKVADNKKLRLFVCGPTVYDYIHIGNARTYIVFDNLVRYLRALGVKVFYLQNITDIDNKIIRRAAEENTNAKSLAKKYEKYYHEDEKALGIKSVTKYARATAHIKQIVRQIQTLIAKGHAYKIDDGYYFDISTFPEYGKLAKRTVNQAEDSVSRIDENVNKKNKGDFALWKFKKENEPSWKTPIGEGRPGWHIEDTAITERWFGPQYDIHGGAVDLKFPHHEAEIAQQEAASGKKPMVKVWMHSGFLVVGGEKMAKSSGNFVTVRDFLKQYPVEVLRYLVAAHHYRSPLDYSE
ncbi:MAG: Cysteinyl-tRNA ligase, partial [Parcubacteria group bacterium GW2011_GWA2_47_8b]